MAKRFSRRDFVRCTVSAGAGVLAGKLLAAGSVLGAARGEAVPSPVTGPEETPAVPEVKKTPLNVGYLPISDHLILPVSHALDGERYEHVSVTPMLCKSWDEILGKADMGILQAAFMLAPLAMHKASMGSSLRCALLGHTDGSVIASRPEIKNAKTLVKHTIGIPHAMSTHRVLLYKYFKDAKIENMDDVHLVKVPPPLTVKQMKAGTIDAYAVAEPWGQRGVSSGQARILEYSRDILPGHVCCLVMMERRFMEKHPAAIPEWVHSLQGAGSFIHDDPLRAGELQAPYMKLEPDEIAQVVKSQTISYHNLNPDRKKLQTMHDLARECSLLSQDCDLDGFTWTGLA